MTVSPPALTATCRGRNDVTRSAASRAAAARIGRDGGGARRLPRRQLDGQLVAADERHLEHPEQEQHHHRQREGQLDRRLSGGPAAAPAARGRADAPVVHRRSHLVDDGVDDPVEEPADLGRPATGGGPGDDEQGDERGGQQDEGVLGGGLAAVAAARGTGRSSRRGRAVASASASSGDVQAGDER